MKNKTIPYVALIIFPLVLFSWMAVGLFAWTISRDESARASRAQVTQDAQDKGAAATRLHSLVRETAAERAQLDSALRVDIVSIVDLIEAAGKAAGVVVIVSDVQPENVSLPQVAGGRKVSVTGFVVGAQGKFSLLMHVVQLLETLPVPSSIGRLDIEHKVSASPGVPDTWQMNAYIRVLTASDSNI